MKKLIVLSGINIRSGGTLSIYKAFLDEIEEKHLYDIFDFTAMVSNKTLFDKYENINIIEFPKEKTSRAKRYYYEYVWFNKFSRKHDVYLWLSLNDQTPRVRAQHQALYFHNPSTFYNCSKYEYKYDRWFFWDSKLYKYLVRFNVKNNDCVYVQQKWLAEAFCNNIKKTTIHLFPPNNNIINCDIDRIPNSNEKFTFFYPAGARIFKNFDVILKAASDLEKTRDDFKVVITIDGNENSYTQHLKSMYGTCKSVEWIGFQTLENTYRQYSKSDCLLFPSKLETWGLPLSEAKIFDLKIIAADLPYAYETLGDYDKTFMFNPDDPEMLSHLMNCAIDGELPFKRQTNMIYPEYPEIHSFEELIKEYC